MFKSVVKRFGKGFIAGGVAGALLVINSGVVITSVEDLKKLGMAVVVGFITGGLLAIEKALNWTTVPPLAER